MIYDIYERVNPDYTDSGFTAFLIFSSATLTLGRMNEMVPSKPPFLCRFVTCPIAKAVSLRVAENSVSLFVSCCQQTETDR